MVCEAGDDWTLPGGWLDVNRTAALSPFTMSSICERDRFGNRVRIPPKPDYELAVDRSSLHGRPLRLSRMHRERG
jgi:hypothetical protein